MLKVFIAALGSGLAVGAKDFYQDWKAAELARPEHQRRFSDTTLRWFERAVVCLLLALAAWIIYCGAWLVLGSHGYMMPAPPGINYP